MSRESKSDNANNGDNLVSDLEVDVLEPEIMDSDDAEDQDEDLAANAPVLVGDEKQMPATSQMGTLQRYLWEARQYPLLTREEETELAQRYAKTKDPEAAARLVTSNLRLVVKIAMDHQRYWMRNLLDLIQEGNIGLLQAVQKFDPFRDIKFSYYASFWIKAYILKFIMDNWRMVRVGTTQAQRKLFYKLRREKEKLQAQGITPGPRLLSDRLGVTEKDVIEMEQRLDSWELSLDSPVRDDSDDTHKNLLPSDEATAEENLADNELKSLFHEKIMDFRETLDEKDRDILDNRLLSEKPETLSDLGERHGVSRERIRQLQVRLMENLREYLEEQIPDFEGQFSDLVAGD